MANAVALGIASDGSAIPIRLTPAGLLSVSGGSGSAQGPGNYKGESFVLMGIASDGQITPIAVDSSGNIQTSGSSGGSGTVTSVGLTAPSILSVTGSPVTNSGTLAITLATQSANTLFAGPTSGGVVAPAFRALVGADLPATITKATAFSIAGAASAPALSVTGVPFAGTGTTSFPQLYINDSTATPSTTLSTAGTYLGVNGHGTKDLMNLMVDGISKASVSSAGVLSLAAGSASAVAINAGTANSGIWFDGGIVFTRSGVNAAYIDQVQGVLIKSTLPLAWASGDPDATGGDLKLFRDAANTLAQRNGTTTQVFNLYATYTDASNYERLSITANSIGYANAGTGSPRAFSVLRASGAALNIGEWQVTSAGHLVTTDNTYDIGASGATRPRSVYVGTSLTTPSLVLLNGGFTANLTIDGSANTVLSDTSGSAIKFFFNGNSGASLTSTGSFSWSSTTATTGTRDLFIYRDAANTLAQRNGVTAQEFRLYNTYTDASNYERGFLRWNANGLELGTQALGTGTGTRTIRFYTNNTEWWNITGIGNLHAVSNLNIWNGTSALATTATAGFLGVNSCAGTPTGVPASVPTGQIPMVVDSTNSKLYAYIGGSWKGIVLV